MIVIPGLWQPLKAAGKRVTSWSKEGSGLTVEAGSVRFCRNSGMRLSDASGSTGDQKARE